MHMVHVKHSVKQKLCQVKTIERTRATGAVVMSLTTAFPGAQAHDAIAIIFNTSDDEELRSKREYVPETGSGGGESLEDCEIACHRMSKTNRRQNGDKNEVLSRTRKVA